MIPQHNMNPIKKGDTWSYSLYFYSDADWTTAENVSTYSFKLMAKNAAGVTQFTWTNSDFIQGIDTNIRTVTLSSATTSAYNSGEFVYELQATIGAVVKTYMQGYIRVYDQTTI